MPRTTTRPAKAAKKAVAKKTAAKKTAAGAARKAAAPRRAPVERKPQPPEAPIEARRPTAPRVGDARSKYVYCVIESEKPLRFGPLGLGAEPSDVHTVHFRDLAAVVSDTPREVIDATRENILAHERVNEAVMRSHTVIPMSFGTVFKTGDDIVELLRAAYDAFTDVLQKMRDKLEFGLKVLWDRDQIVREIERADENVRRLKDEISSQSGSTYFARMQYGRMVDAALEDYVERYVGAIVDRAAAGLHRLPLQQADRREDDHERGLPGHARAGERVRREGQGDRRALRVAHLQVHGPLAALQLRQHPPEARAGARLRMIIVDSLLIGGLRFVLDKLIAAADAELSDDSALRETLLEAQVRRELGELSEEDYLALEADLLQRIQQVQGGARGPIEAASGYEIAGVEATFTGDEHSKDRG